MILESALRLAGLAICAFVALYMIVPMVLIFVISFSSSALLSFPPPGFSLRWYENLFTRAEWLHSLNISIKIMALSAPISTLLGVGAALGLARASSSVLVTVRALLMAPLIVPTIITAAGIYLAFAAWGLVGTMAGIVIAHVVLSVPYVLVTVSAALQSLDGHLEQAAMTLGASPYVAFRRITLPLILPGVLSGLLFSAVLSFDELLVSLFLGTPQLRTVPVQMWSNVMGDIDPAISALACIILLVSLVLMALQSMLGSKNTSPFFGK
jgi:putative spermidine/putrescine transport system permease protein